MSDKGLEVVWVGLLSIIVPDLQQIVLAAGQHVASIVWEVGTRASTLMNSMDLTNVGSLEGCKAVEPNSLVLRHYNKLTIILCELEAAHNLSNIDLVFEDDGVWAVDHNVVAVFAHDTE